MMLKQKTNLLVVSEDAFRREINSSMDVKLDNLKHSEYDEAKKADIVMYQSNNMTILMKNRYGSEGMVV